MDPAARRLPSAAIARAGLAFPIVITGVALPLDFIREVDGYLKYVQPWELTLVYSWGWVLCATVGVAIGLLAIVVAAALARLSGRTALAIGVVEWLVFTTIVLLLLRTAKLWMEANEWQLAAWMAAFKYEIALAAAAACAWWIWRRSRVPPGLASLAAGSALAGLALAVAVFAGAGVSAFLRSSPTFAPPGKPATPLPDIVLLTIDTLAADHMSLYGYRRPTTPHIDELAQTADVFERFYANSNLTTPAVASYIHGVRPWTHRAIQPNAGLLQRIADDGLVASLKRAGYHTMAVATNPLAAPTQNRSNRWFDENVEGQISTLFPLFLARDAHGRAAAAMNTFGAVYGLLDRFVAWTGLHETQNKYDPQLAVSAAKKMVGGRAPGVPAFLWMHLLPPHDPYATPAPFIGRFDARPSARTRFDSSPPVLFMARADPAFPDRVMGRYDESIAYVDHFVGQFVAWLKSQGLYDRSLIVISADHGESFVKGYGGHTGPLLHEGLIRVPLIVKAPDQKIGRRLGVVAEQIDLMPTILELAGMAAPAPREGRSLVPAMRGEQMADAIFSMNFEQSNRFGALDRGTVAMIEPRWKYVHYFGAIRYPMMPRLEDSLFDLEGDPDETVNLIATQPAIAARMLGEIQSRLRRHGGAPG